MTRKALIWWLITLLIAGWLLWMTLRPNPAVAEDLAPLTGPAAERGIAPHVLIGLAGNVAVFIPLGASLSQAAYHSTIRRDLEVAIGIGSAFSLTIEGLQLTIPGRVSGLDDWMLNTLGVALGVLAARWMQRVYVTSSLFRQDAD